jgi:hypothetical protein
MRQSLETDVFDPDQPLVFTTRTEADTHAVILNRSVDQTWFFVIDSARWEAQLTEGIQL